MIKPLLFFLLVICVKASDVITLTYDSFEEQVSFAQ